MGKQDYQILIGLPVLWDGKTEIAALRTLRLFLVLPLLLGVSKTLRRFLSRSCWYNNAVPADMADPASIQKRRLPGAEIRWSAGINGAAAIAGL